MAFSDEVKNQVWEKGVIVQGYDSKIIRQDCCGAWILFDSYGNTDDDFGWQIDHIYPQSLGGDDNIINLRPMNWHNNESKSDDYPVYKAVVESEGNKNVFRVLEFTINEVLQKKLEELYN